MENSSAIQSGSLFLYLRGISLRKAFDLLVEPLNTAAINENTTAQTQKILDAIAQNRMADMQNQINQLQLQNAMANVIRFPNAYTFNGGVFPPVTTAAAA